jgi:hypothetical protein
MLNIFMKRIDMKTVYILLLPIVVLLVLIGLNYRQLYAAWAIRSESSRLEKIALNTTEIYQNPSPLEDKFDGELSPRFWNFSIINGGGEVSHESSWHAAAITSEDGLAINHFPDTEFDNESSQSRQPAAERYNNVTLIGASGFRPTPSRDVVLKFSAKASDDFYGTAGVIFQPVGTLQPDGIFTKPFDMFGFSVAGKESSIQGVNGALCYLALNWVPVKVNTLSVDAHSDHQYEIRLRWVSTTQWLGLVSVDGIEQCEIPMPAFGPVEVHVWSDNALVLSTPRRWWELAPAMDLKFQNGGDKEFSLGFIQVFAESR